MNDARKIETDRLIRHGSPARLLNRKRLTQRRVRSVPQIVFSIEARCSTEFAARTAPAAPGNSTDFRRQLA